MSRFSLRNLVLGWSEQETRTSIGGKFYVLPLSGSAKNSGRTGLSRMIMALDDKLDRLLASTSVRAYGMFLMGFGLLSLLLHFAKDYLDFYEEVPLIVLILGALFTALGIPLLFSDKPISVLCAELPWTDYLFFEFFCIKRTNGRVGRGVPHVVALILGLALAAVGAFIPMEWVSLGIVAAVYLIVTVSSPEFSFFAALLALPFMPLLPSHEVIFAIVIGVTAISFIRKVLLGKRVIYLEQYDLYISILVLAVLVAGVFVKGVESFSASLLVLVFTMGYPMAGGMITNRRVADRAISATILPSVPVSCYAVYQLVREVACGNVDPAGARGFFESSSTLAVYLITTLVYSLYFVKVRRSAVKRTLYTIIAILNLLALVATLEVWALVACFLGLLAFEATRLRYATGLVSTVLGIVPYGIVFFGDAIAEKVAGSELLSALGLGELLARIRVSLHILADNPLLGVGIGADCFAAEYEKYSGGIIYPNSGNLLVEIACEAGIVALTSFLLIMLIRVIHKTVYCSYLKDSRLGTLSDFTSGMLVTLLAYGAFCYLWADVTNLYLFWCVFGIGSAALRISKQEFDDLSAYLSDGAAADASSIDVLVRSR